MIWLVNWSAKSIVNRIRCTIIHLVSPNPIQLNLIPSNCFKSIINEITIPSYFTTVRVPVNLIWSRHFEIFIDVTIAIYWVLLYTYSNETCTGILIIICFISSSIALGRLLHLFPRTLALPFRLFHHFIISHSI